MGEERDELVGFALAEGASVRIEAEGNLFRVKEKNRV